MQNLIMNYRIHQNPIFSRLRGRIPDFFCIFIFSVKMTTPTIPISLGCTHILSLLRFFISITNSRNRKNRFSWKCVGKESFFLQNQNFHKICNRTIPKYPCLVYQKAGNWRCSKNGIFVISRNYDKLRVSKYTDQ